MKNSIIIYVAAFILSFVMLSHAQEGKDKVKTSTSINEVEGEVSAIGKDYIAVVYKRDPQAGIEYEMLLPIPKGVELVHKKSLNEIGVGDIVRVAYEEVTEEDKAGVRNNRKGKTVTFIKPAEKKPESGMVILEGETLPLKGMKNEK